MPYWILLIPFSSLAALFVLARRAKDARIREIERRFAGVPIAYRDDGANLFGQRSRGLMQVRGNGVLMVTDKELFFVMFLPRREIRIPMEAIRRIETPSSFLGKSILRSLLRVDFTNEKGERDAAAWHVRDLARCKKELERRIPPP